MIAPSTESMTPRGRPRESAIDQRLAEATLSLLRDAGPSAVTVERVALASGVSKTSIYRRHANRAELLTTVLQSAIGVPDIPAIGTGPEKLREALEQAWRQMSDVLGSGGLAALVGNSDPEFTELFRAAIRPYDDALVVHVEADASVGLLRSDVDADGVVTLLLGAYLGELLRRGRIAPDWLDRTLALMWVAIAPVHEAPVNCVVDPPQDGRADHRRARGPSRALGGPAPKP